MEDKAAAAQLAARPVVTLLRAGRMTMAIARVLPAAEAPAAFEYLARPGKIKVPSQGCFGAVYPLGPVGRVRTRCGSMTAGYREC